MIDANCQWYNTDTLAHKQLKFNNFRPQTITLKLKILLARTIRPSYRPTPLANESDEFERISTNSR